MRWFWKALCLFAYRRWRRREDEIPDGIPGIRDARHRCHGYDPGPRGGWDCQSDGHYLCRGCSHYRPAAYYDSESPHYMKVAAPDDD